MKKGVVLFAMLILAAGLAWSQTAAASPAQGTPAQAAANTGIPDGVIVKVEAKQTVETQKVKVGDAVKLEALEDGKGADGKTVRGANGQPAVPRKTKFLAKVSSVQAGTKQNKEAKLSLLVTSATFPNGKTVPFLGVVLGPFQVSALAPGTGLDMQGRGSGASATAQPPSASGPTVASGIEGVDLKIDPQLGTVLVAPRNFSLENGTQFHVRYVNPAEHPPEPAK